MRCYRRVVHRPEPRNFRSWAPWPEWRGWSRGREAPAGLGRPHGWGAGVETTLGPRGENKRWREPRRAQEEPRLGRKGLGGTGVREGSGSPIMAPTLWAPQGIPAGVSVRCLEGGGWQSGEESGLKYDSNTEMTEWLLLHFISHTHTRTHSLPLPPSLSPSLSLSLSLSQDLNYTKGCSGHQPPSQGGTIPRGSARALIPTWFRLHRTPWKRPRSSVHTALPLSVKAITTDLTVPAGVHLGYF